MSKKIKIIDLIERLNNFDFKRGTKIKFLDKIYLYDYPNLVGIYEIGKPTKREYSIFAQFDITNLYCEAEILEDNTEKIDIQNIEKLSESSDATYGQDARSVAIENRFLINKILEAVKQLDRKSK